MSKKISTLFLAFAMAGMSFIPSVVQAQNAQGQISANAGVGVSLVGALFSAVKNNVNAQPGATVTLHSTPVITAGVDYAIADHFSLGVAGSYQSFSSEYTNYTYTNSQGVDVTGSYKDKVTRMNFGLRPLFHFGDNENFDPYFGARISFTNWSYSTSNPDPYYDFGDVYSFIGASPVKFQVLFGAHYFFNEIVGINGEVAVGPSYYLMGGLSFKFGGSSAR